MNVVYENNDIRFVNNISSSYDLTDLNIYIPKEYRDKKILLSICNAQNDTSDIIKLIRLNNHNNFDIYVPDTKQNGNFNDGKFRIKIMFCDLTSDTILFSKQFELSLRFGHFKNASVIYKSEDIEKAIHTLYKQIMKMTEMNINIHKEILEMKGGGNI